MKKVLLPLIMAFILTNTTSAQVVADTVSIGAGYANQTWYSLENDEQANQSKNNWDIAFDCSGFGSSVYINSITGTMLWKYPGSDTAGWEALDTTGIAGWPALYNTDTSWALGAFDKNKVTANPFDLGWGVYNSITHIVTGDSLYVIKLAGGTYKKLWIESLSGGAYNFCYADLNGDNLHNVTFSKSGYTGKNFGYYSLESGAEVDREPVAANWDLIFTQYTTFIPSAYTVSGILSNKGVSIAQANNVGNVATYNDWSAHTFTSQINEIGYDWKSFTGAAYEVTDSLVYFIKTATGDLWKFISTGFAGSSTGNYMFSKEKLSSTGIKEESGNVLTTLSIYPNPSNGGQTNIIYNFEKEVSKAMLMVMDLSGRMIASASLINTAGLHTYDLNTAGLNSGMYIVSIEVDGKRAQQKLIIQ